MSTTGSDIEAEIHKLTTRIERIDIKRDVLVNRLTELKHNRNQSNRRTNSTERVTTSELASRTRVTIPTKYHRFIALEKRDHTGKCIFVGDRVKVTTRYSRRMQVGTVAYLTEYKVTVLFKNRVKQSKDPSYIEVIEAYDRQGKSL